MRAVMIRETGGPDVLTLEEVERPELGEGEVLVRVRAASVNPIDWKYRRGLVEKDLPAVLGNDVSGTVESSQADQFSEGDEVFGIASSGGYAEFAVAPAATLAAKPAAVSHEQAAAIGVAGLTAWQAVIDRGKLEEGQSALIAGAAGGVGHLAVQLAKHAAARVIGTGSARNHDFVLGLGADEYIDYTSEDVGERARDMDLIFDTVGGETTQTLVPALAEVGILVTIAAAPPESEAEKQGGRAELLVMSPESAELTQIAELIAGGDLRVELEVIPLEEVRRAHELSESGHTRGKIVLSLEG